MKRFGALPEYSGVYAVFASGKLIYVGVAKSIARRLKGHSRYKCFKRLGADEVRSIPITQKTIALSIEQWLIRKWHPVLNGFVEIERINPTMTASDWLDYDIERSKSCTEWMN